ncbi:hypothetical protein AKO1_009417 [Acrasis kona]|uniref:Uncharacterized protein n=1 Tax=Acrasis kona TaxID=1008807 RepID=A0AAW2ZLN8_9EUKA
MKKILLFTLLLFSTIFAQQNLNLGVSVKNRLLKDTMDQFVVDIPEGSIDQANELVFIVTPFSGDADLYIKFDSSPTKDTYDLKSAGTGSDFIAINSTSPFATKRKAYIGALSIKSDVDFSILAYLSNKHVTLYEGIPQLARVRARESIYFRYTPDENESGKILLSNVAITGDPDIYVSTTVQYPNSTHYDYRQVLFGSDLLLDSNHLLLAIGLTHFATQTQLIQNIPIRLELDPSSYAYFAFNLTTPTDNLVIQLEPNTRGGDPDLYVSRTNQKPSQSDAEFKSMKIGFDQVSINNPTLSTYYIAVRAFAFATIYTLVVRPSGTSTILIDGQSQSAMGLANKYDYYKFTYNDESKTDNRYVEFTAAPTQSGSIQLYLGDDSNHYPTKQSHSKKSNETLIIQMIQVPDAADGIYYVGVLSESDSSYMITANTKVQHTRLLEGKSVSYYIERDHYRKFYFDAINTTSNIIISVSAQRDADLYVGVEEDVSSTKKIWSSASAQGDVITIEQNDPNYIKLESPKRLYIAVYGYQSTTFTLTANSDSITNLNDDTSVRGTKKEMHEFFKRDYGGDSLTIEATGNKYYYIGVYGYSGNSTFDLTVTTQSVTLSANGYSRQEYVKAGSYRNYKTFGSGTLSTTVTLLVGSTILYMNNNGQKANSTNYQIKDETWPGHHASISGSGRFDYSIYGIEDSQFTISSIDDYYDPIVGQLTLGEVRMAEISNSTANVYRYRDGFWNSDLIYVYVNLLTPDASFNVYVSQIDRSPRHGSSRWNHTNANQDLVMRINSTQLDFYRPLYISITSNSKSPIRVQLSVGDSDTPIRVTQEQSNKFVTRAGESRSYRVLSLQNSKRFYASVDSCDDYPADQFYMSVDDPSPTAEKHTLASTVSSKSKFTQIIDDSSKTNSYYFIKTATSTRTRWQSIYANTKVDQRPILSDPKIEKSGLVATNLMRLTFKKCTTHNAYRMPITYHVYKRPIQRDLQNDVNFDTPCSIKYHEQSTQIGTVDVPPDFSDSLSFDLDVTQDSSYVVNVIARDAYGLETVYDKLGFNLKDPNELLIGKPIRSSVNQTKYHQFTLNGPNLSAGQQLVIALTTLNGDVDMYVSKDSPPTKDSNPTWKSENGGFDVLVIPHDDPKYQSTKLYIGVLGDSRSLTSSFTIVAYVQSSNTALNLLDGQPQIMSVNQDKYNHFEYLFNDNGTFTVTLSSISGDADLYINSNDQIPDKNNYQWTSNFDTIDQVKIQPSDMNFKSYSNYKISTYGYRDSVYLITATKHFTNHILPEGIQQGGRLDRNEFAYYQFTLMENSNLIITVLPIDGGGDPDLYVSTTHQRPDYYSSTWRSQSVGIDTLTIESNDPNFKIGTYYIAVHGYNSILNYHISATTTKSSMVLVDGSPSRGSISKSDQISYYRFFHGFEINSFQFKVIGDHQQDLNLYVSLRSHPTPSKREYEGIKVSGYTTMVTIPSNKPRGWYYVGVSSSSIGNFTITASQEQRAVLLKNGMIDSFNQVSNGYYKYFMYDVSTMNHDSSVTISIKSLRGDPDLYVSTNTSTPTNTIYTWSSATLDSDSVTIHQSEISNSKTIFIGVHAFYSDCEFDIIAFDSNTTIQLRDAQNVPGSATPKSIVQYKYEMTNRGRLKIDLYTVSSYPSGADLYVSDRPNPSPIQYKYKSTSYSSHDYVIIEEANPGMYYVSVVSSGNNMVSYTLMASTQYAHVDMGTTAIDFVDQGKSRTYRTSVPDQSFEYIVVSVTLISGQTNLQLKTNTDDSQPFTHESKSWPGNSIVIYKVVPGTWTLLVTGVQDSNYFIVVHEQLAKLSQGQPMNGMIGDQIDYSTFVYNVGEVAHNLYLSLRIYGENGLLNSNRTFLNVMASQNVSGVVKQWPVQTAFGGSFGQSIQLIDQITPEVPLFIKVYKSKSNDENVIRFQLIASAQFDPIYVTQGFANVFSNLNQEFVVLTSKHSKSMLVEFLSCDNVNFNQVNLIGDKIRNSSNPIYKSKSSNHSSFRMILNTQQHHDAIEQGVPYYLSFVKNSPSSSSSFKIPITYTVFASTDGTWHKPPVRSHSPKLEFLKRNSNENQFKIKAHVDGMYRYDVYALQLSDRQSNHDEEAIRNSINYDTPCSVLKAHGSVLLTHYGHEDDGAEITLSASHSYLINVLVTDLKVGSQEVFIPLLIRPDLVRARVVSPGGIILFVFGLLVALYLIVGMIYNVIVNKKRGIVGGGISSIIPHFDFWCDLPFLIKDGILFIVTCGKRGSGGYSDLYQIPSSGTRSRGTSNGAVNGDIDDLIDDNPFKIDQVEEARSNASLVKGYGAI